MRLISNGQVLITVALVPGLNYGAQGGVIPGPQRMELIDTSGSVALAATGGRCISDGCPDCIYSMNYQVLELKTDSGSQGTCPYRVCQKSVFAHYMVRLKSLQCTSHIDNIGWNGLHGTRPERYCGCGVNGIRWIRSEYW